MTETEQAAVLTDAERTALWRAGDHHPDLCDCSPDLPDGDWKQVCGALWDTFVAVEAIIDARTTATTGAPSHD